MWLISPFRTVVAHKCSCRVIWTCPYINEFRIEEGNLKCILNDDEKVRKGEHRAFEGEELIKMKTIELGDLPWVWKMVKKVVSRGNKGIYMGRDRNKVE